MNVDSVLSKGKDGKSGSEHKEKSEPKGKRHKHGVKHTMIEHHDEGHVVTHHMDDGSQTSHAVADLDGVHDNLEQTMGEPNEGEQEMAGAEGVGAEPTPGGASPMPAQGA